MTTRTTYTLEAFTLDRKRVFDLHVFFDRGTHRPNSDIINVRGPISFYTEDLAFLNDPEEDQWWPLFCIDAMGRNFGTKPDGTSVYVYTNKVKAIVEEHQKSLIR